MKFNLLRIISVLLISVCSFQIKAQTPVANAGKDKVVYLPYNQIKITASDTVVGGTITKRKWENTSIYNAVLSNETSRQVSISGLQEGTYIFRYTVTDDKGQIAVDEVKVKDFLFGNIRKKVDM